MPHEIYIKRCIRLAYNGLGNTYPNPMVGSVIVHKGKIIGEGWHRKAGTAHAEVNAIAAVKNQELLPESTIYVSLEPCSHYGKTPPCADLIIDKKIKKVVIGTADPFAEVNGSGIQRLKSAGCEVIVGVLENECKELNKRFFTFHQQKRPYIILKWAETTDGFIAPKNKKNIEPQWITNIYSRQYVHKLRSSEQAILVGTNTVTEDNPKLDTRDWHGTNPLRVIIDATLRTPADFAVWNDAQPTLFLAASDKILRNNYKNTFVSQIDFSKQIPFQITDTLYKRGIQSLIVEGGASVLQQFIDSSCWDEAFVFTGQIAFGSGLQAPKLHGGNRSCIANLEGDLLTIFKKNS
ncbi:MAG: bifunctional diaminohydroxyphosphoribosylaminopyrimidine deaminase/5-amino-6-(5-phosphoribosylamino)uracil reductase RibD [Capnocytophaga sp.]|nr:bifunctional diaminohydroxyphosphoribosylaminopyrimidine deaminase/5-amino-6-(5-phosphoribosylamino)uracil reductase RibD [Capnocytophaga sp.]